MGMMENIRELIQKIGFFRLMLVVLAGVLLLVLSLPSGGDSQTEDRVEESEALREGDALFLAMEQYAGRLEKETAEILSKVEGLGEVEVMLTLASSEEKVTLQDDSITEDDSLQEDTVGGSKKDSSYQSKGESVLVKKDGEESPYVVQIHSPAIEGVIVVAQGAGSGKKEKEIIEAIQALFPIEPHKIKVMKME
ncbi:MAG: stage III sporulation protein AG [Lachnospiraceae bacterium]|jgi:stage III sporulation protein AG|nr:stage III sporulation protein AG [Lachnospiraceae bacterium]